MVDKKEKKEEKKEEKNGKSLAERILEDEGKAIVGRATAEMFGLNRKEATLATQIVLKAMEMQEKVLAGKEGRTKELEAEVKEARQSLEHIQFESLTEQLKKIEEDQKKVDEAVHVQKDAFTYYYQVKAEVDRMVKLIQPQLAMSDATQIKLKELELEQQRVLVRSEADNLQSRQRFDMLLVIFREYMEMKRSEILRKEALQAETMRGLSDIVAAIGAAVANSK